MRKTKKAAVKAIKDAILDLFPLEDQAIIERSVVEGDPYEWGASVATIVSENGIDCLSYYGNDWMSNSIKIQDHVKANTGLSIFIECINCAVHGVYWK